MSIVRAVAKAAYNRFLRKHLPRVWGECYDEIEAPVPRLLDRKTLPEYERAFIDQLVAACDPGDDVVIVGGGFGVSAVAAARAVEVCGAVTVFEPAVERVRDCRTTAQRNHVRHRVSVEHAAVGPLIDAWGDASDARSVSPEALPDADVLALDAEGAEVAILERLPDPPGEIVVEYHGEHSVERDDIHAWARANEYDLIGHAWEDRTAGIGICRLHRAPRTQTATSRNAIVGMGVRDGQ